MKCLARAFSLTELLVVILIITLIAALLFPVFRGVQDHSKMVPCMANLRQVYVATAGYMSDNDDGLPASLRQLLAINPNMKPVLACPMDSTTGANLQETELAKSKISYFYILPLPDFRAAILQADPNHGIAYCVVHGERKPEMMPNYVPARDTTGLVLRLRRDGSIQRAQVGSWCGPKTATGWVQGRQAWSLLSDTHCVEPFCYGLSEPCN